jgi:hypothetical protein
MAEIWASRGTQARFTGHLSNSGTTPIPFMAKNIFIHFAASTTSQVIVDSITKPSCTVLRTIYKELMATDLEM